MKCLDSKLWKSPVTDVPIVPHSGSGGCDMTPRINRGNQRRRWESNPHETAFAGSCLAVWLRHQNRRVSLPGVEPRLRPSQSRVHPPHSKDFMRIARQGIEPCLAVSKTTVHPPHSRAIESIASRQCTSSLEAPVQQRADDWIRTSMIAPKK